MAAAIEAGALPDQVGPAAVEHGLGPMLWRALGAAGARQWLGAAGSAVERSAELCAFEETFALPRAIELGLAPLVEAGFEPLVLKGPTISIRYPEAGLRAMGDIDMLLPAGQHGAALEVMRSAGWNVLFGAAADRYDTTLTHPDVPVLAVELHYGFEARFKEVTSADPTDLWSRRIPIDCYGTPAFGLPLTDDMVMLALHAGKPYHSFRRLIWVADFAMVAGHAAEAGHPVDWPAVQALSVARGGRTMVAVAMALARRAGVEAPAELFPLPTRRWRADALDSLLDERWPLRCDDDAVFPLQFALTDRPGARARLLVGSPLHMSRDSKLQWAVGIPRETVSRAWRWALSVVRSRGRSAKALGRAQPPT